MKDHNENGSIDNFRNYCQPMIKNTGFYNSIKDIIVNKLQSGDQKSLMEYESVLVQFLKSNDRQLSRLFDSRRECELFELVTDFFVVKFTKENDDLPYRVHIFKQEDSNIPDFKFSDAIKPVPKFQVLRRDHACDQSTVSQTDIPTFSAEDEIEKLKEKEESYNKARALIFGDFDEDSAKEQDFVIDSFSHKKSSEIPVTSTVVDSGDGYPAHNYYNDASAFVRTKRPSMTQYIPPDHGYYQQQPYYPPRISPSPPIYGQECMFDPSVQYRFFSPIYGPTYQQPCPFPNMMYRPDYYPGFVPTSPGFPYFYSPGHNYEQNGQFTVPDSNCYRSDFKKPYDPNKF